MEPRLWPLTALQRDIVSATHLASDPLRYVAISQISCAGPVSATEARFAIEHVARCCEALRVSIHVDEMLDPIHVVHDDVEPMIAQLDSDAQPSWPTMQLDDPSLARWVLRTVPGADELVGVELHAHHVVLDASGTRALVRHLNHTLQAMRAGDELPGCGESFNLVLAQRESDRAEAAQIGSDDEAGHSPSRQQKAGSLSPQAGSWLRAANSKTARAELEFCLDAAQVAQCAQTAGVTPAVVLRVSFLAAVDALANSPAMTTVIHSGHSEDWHRDVVGMQSVAGQTTLHASANHRLPLLETLRLHMSMQANESNSATSRSQTERSLALLSIDTGQVPVKASEIFVLQKISDQLDYALAATITKTQATSANVVQDAYRVNVQVAGGIDSASTLVSSLRDAMRDITRELIRELGINTAQTPSQPLHLANWASNGGRNPADAQLPGELVGANNTNPAARPVHELIRQQFVRHAGGLAVTTCTGPATQQGITYAELGTRAEKLASEFTQAAHAHYHRSDIAVLALALPRTTDAIVALTAGLLAGVAVMPIDPTLPARRRAAILTAAGAKLLVTRSSQGDLVVTDCSGTEPNGRAQTNSTKNSVGTTSARSGNPQGWYADFGPDGVAAITLTSGTTGVPKSVLVTQRGLAALAARNAVRLYPAADAPLRVGHSAALFFDAHWDAFLALAGGHSLYLFDDATMVDPFDMAHGIAHLEVDYADFTPTLWQLLLDSGQLHVLPRVCVVGGEAFPQALWDRMREMPGGHVITNLYGPSECTVDALAASVRDSERVNIGSPSGYSTAMVLDNFLCPTYPGVVGELYLAGPQLALGYSRRSGETSHRFVAHLTDPGARMYRTGDAAWVDLSGKVYLRGRTDDQMSLHGLRIEPAEIEAALCSAPGVAAAFVTVHNTRLSAVIARSNLPWNQSSASIDTGRETTTFDVELRDFLRQQLPASLVPTTIAVVADMPSNAQGKIDRLAIRKILDAHASQVTDGTANSAPALAGGVAMTGTQNAANVPGLLALCASVRAVLNIADQPLTNDATAEPPMPPALSSADHSLLRASLATLGGDSIAAIRVRAAIRQRGYSITASELNYAASLSAAGELLRPLEPVAPGVSTSTMSATSASDASDLSDALSGRHELAQRVQPELTTAQLARLRTAIHESNDARGELTDVAPLLPTQVGMLLDAERNNRDVYIASLDLDVLLRVSRAQVTAAWLRVLQTQPHLMCGIWQGDRESPLAFTVTTAPVMVRENPNGAPASELSMERAAGSFVCLDIFTAEGPDAGRDDPITRVTLHVHHVVADGVSMPILLDAFQRELLVVLDDASLVTARADQLAQSVEFTRFAQPLRMQRDYFARLDLAAHDAAHASLMRAEFEGFSPALISDMSVSSATFMGSRIVHKDRLDLPDGVPARAALALQQAIGDVLCAATRREEIAYALALSGRDVALDGVEDAIGMFMATTAIRHRREVTVDAEFTQLRGFMQRTAPAHLMGWSALLTALKGAPCNILVVIESQTRVTQSAGSSPESPSQDLPLRVRSGQDATTFPLALTAGFTADGIVLEVESLTDAVRSGEAKQLAELILRQVSLYLHGQPNRRSDQCAVQTLAWSGDAIALRSPRPTVTDPGLTTSAVRSAPDPEVESEQLAMIRQHFDAVLGPAGTSEHFIHRGGDSLRAMRLVGALRGAGLRVTIRDIYAQPTPSELARWCAPATAEWKPSADLGGARPGTPRNPTQLVVNPAVAWWFEHGEAVAEMTQIRTFELPSEVVADLAAGRVSVAELQRTLAGALTILYQRHDALRLCIPSGANSEVEPQKSTRATTNPTPVAGEPVAPQLAAGEPVAVIRDIDSHYLSQFKTRLLGQAPDLQSAAFDARSRLSVEDGILLTATLVPSRENHTTTPQLVLVAHHLCVDAYTWLMLLDEFSQLLRDPGVQLPPAASLQGWLDEQPQRVADARVDLPFWLGSLAAFRTSAAQTNTARGSKADRISDAGATVSASSTEKLQAIAAHTGVRFDEIITLATLISHGNPALIETESHGRPDLSHSEHVGAAGWFTTTWPVACAGVDDSAASIANAVVRLRQARARGISYGLLRYCSDATDIAALRESERLATEAIGGRTLVNFLGQMEGGSEYLDTFAAPALTDAIEVNAHLETSGELYLGVRSRVEATTADSLAAALQTLADRDESWWAEVAHSAELSRDEIAPTRLDLPADFTDLDSTWPLTPVQRSMLHQGAGAEYIGVLAFDILINSATVRAHYPTADRSTDPTAGSSSDSQGALPEISFDSEGYRQAWLRVLDAHAALRLVPLDGPLDGPPDTKMDGPYLAGTASAAEQVLAYACQQAVSLSPLADHDLRPAENLSALIVDGKFISVSCTDAGDRVRVIVHSHHVVLDGWSMPRLIEQVHIAYRDRATLPTRLAENRARSLPASHLAALHQARVSEQPDTDAVVTALHGSQPSALLSRFAVDTPSWQRERKIVPNWPLVAQAARRAGVTTAALLHAAFAHTLARLTATSRPLFSTVHSARTGELESALGMFISTAPFAVETQASPLETLQQAHTLLALLQQHQHANLTQAAQRLDAPQVIDALLVVENYPSPEESALPLGDVRGEDQTEYPLNCTIEFAAESAEVLIECATDVFAAGSATILLADVLAQIAELAGLSAPEASELGTSRSAASAAALRQACGFTSTSAGNPTSNAAGNPTSNSQVASLDQVPSHSPHNVDLMREFFATALQRNSGANSNQQVGANDNLYSLGGDSLTVMRLVTLIKQAGWSIRTSNIALHPSPASLAKHIASLGLPQPEATTQPTPPPTAASATATAPAIPAPKPLLNLGGADLAALTSHVRNS